MTTIPPITDQLGRYWAQPSPDAILVDEKHAVMARATFDQLREYSTTIPSGVYSGKMWKAAVGDKWELRWFSDDPTIPNRCLINRREILCS